jgi:hypothetical protein
LIYKVFFTTHHFGGRGGSFSQCTILEVGVSGHVDRLTRRCYKHDVSFNLEVIQCLSFLSKNNYEVM